ncbi:MAG: hypothetical protein KDJ41_16635 [Hyphomicrobiaceae bacterium]|nr:hypothetical protein [Hyphomicrobiaceae bacterium]
MSIERLTTAARAAGYAMATSDELLEAGRSSKPSKPWRPVEMKPLSEVPATPAADASYTARLKGMLDALTGKKATA